MVHQLFRNLPTGGFSGIPGYHFSILDQGIPKLDPQMAHLAKKNLGGCKVGGILARAVPFNGRLEGIIVGIGINVNTSKEELDRMLGPFFGYLQIQYSVLI